MYFHKFAVAAFAAAIMLGSGLASASPTTYSYLKTIDFGTTVSGSLRVTCATPDANGDIYFTDNGDDGIYHMNPLTATDLNNVDLIFNYHTASDGFGPSSFQGITVATGGDTFTGADLFASGVDSTSNPTAGVLARIHPVDGTTWTVSFLSGLNKASGGCTAVGPNTLAISSYNDGGLDFYTVDTLNNTATQIGSTVQGGGSGEAITVKADLLHSKVYMSLVGEPNTQGIANVFDLGGTPTAPTATYSSGANPLIAGRLTTFLPSASITHYQQVSVKPADQVVAMAINPGDNADPGQGNGLGLYDVSAGGTNLQPFQVITEENSGGAVSTARPVVGHTFFTKNGTDYLLVYFADSGTAYSGSVYIYQKAASDVIDWTVY
jgi:hypothetical protein